MTVQSRIDTHGSEETQGFVSVQVGGQTFGVPVLEVQDVIAPVRIDRIPLAPAEVAGSLNLRGRIVTAVDLRPRLGLPLRDEGERFMCVIVERANELYALLVDDVGDVLWLSRSDHEAAPVTLPQAWRDMSDGLYRLDGDLLLALSPARVLDLAPKG
jgi:purine-binding chemotaxis protein CheW